MDRRGFLTITGTALTGVAASWAMAPSAVGRALDGDRVTDRMVTTLEQRLATLRSLDDQMGGARLLEQARGDLALITELLKSARYTEPIGARLYGLAAFTSFLTGWMAYDTGLRSAGQQYYVGALRAARTAGDDALGSYFLAEMGVHASDANQTKERVELIETAMDKAPRALPPAALSYLHLHRAEALSCNGQHDKAGTAMNQAFAQWERHRPGDMPEWLTWYGEAQLRSTEGKVLMRSGQVERATASFAQSIDKAVPRDQAVRSGRLATARLAARDLDGALDAATKGVGLLEDQVTSARAQARLQKFEAKLTPYRKEPAVREFGERLRALPAVAVA